MLLITKPGVSLVSLRIKVALLLLLLAPLQLAGLGISEPPHCSSLLGPRCGLLSGLETTKFVAVTPQAAAAAIPPLARSLAAAGVVSGTYRMVGTPSKSGALNLQPQSWVDKPVGGSAVGFVLRYDASSGNMVGHTTLQLAMGWGEIPVSIPEPTLVGTCGSLVLSRNPTAETTLPWSGLHQCGGVTLSVNASLHWIRRGGGHYQFLGPLPPAGVEAIAVGGIVRYDLVRRVRTPLQLAWVALREKGTVRTAFATASSSHSFTWPWRAASSPPLRHAAGTSAVVLSLFRLDEQREEETHGNAVENANENENGAALEGIVWHDMMVTTSSGSAVAMQSNPGPLYVTLHAMPPSSSCSHFLLTPDLPENVNWDSARATKEIGATLRWSGVYTCRGATHSVYLELSSDKPTLGYTGRVRAAFTVRRLSWPRTADGNHRCATRCGPRSTTLERWSSSEAGGGPSRGAAEDASTLWCEVHVSDAPGDHPAVRTVQQRCERV